MSPSELVAQYGFPIVAAIGMASIIYYIWIWATNEAGTILDETNTTLIRLIDRIRVLDNDMIRLTQKVNVVTQLKSTLIDKENIKFIDTVNKL